MSATSSVHLTALERKVSALALRRKGKTYQEIGDTLGISQQRAHAIVKEEMKQLDAELREKREEVRSMELDRLDLLQSGVWEKAVEGDTKAIESVLKIMEKRSKLLDLDAPKKVLGLFGEVTEQETIAKARMLGLTIPEVLENDDV